MNADAVVLPSDVRDGDLLTGTLYGNPFTDWVVGLSSDGEVRIKGSSYRLGYDRWYSHVTVTSRKPAPSPPLPWEQPNAAPYWRHTNGAVVQASMLGGEPPDEWVGGYFIPADLIEKLRKPCHTGESAVAVKAILDAADGA